MVVSFLRRKSERVLLYFDEFCKGRIVFVLHIFLSFLYNLRSHISLSLSSFSLSNSLSRAFASNFMALLLN